MSVLISCKTVTTRKDHYCFGCAQLFPKGSYLLYCFGRDCEAVLSYYLCGVCEEVANIIGEDFGYGELKSEESELWHNVKKDMGR